MVRRIPVPLLVLALATQARAGHENAGPAVDLAVRAAELTGTPKEVATGEKRPYFRPLCDADGYPLVGNLVRKGPVTGYQPSAFCAQVRAK